MQYQLKADETIEDLQLNGLHLIQKKKAFRFGMDSVLLAHFARIGKNETVLDLGAGNGILPLLLYGRKKGGKFYAVELQQEAAELAIKNAVLNHLEDKMFVINADAAEITQYAGACFADSAVCNPPYGQPSAALASPSENISVARTQDAHTLDHLLKGAFNALKGKGRLFIIYPAPQMLHLMKKLQFHHLEPKHFQLVYPQSDKPANLVLIEAVKDAKPTLHPMPPLIVYNQDGTLTNDLKSVYHII